MSISAASFIFDLYSKSPVLGNLSKYFTICNTFTSTKYDLAQENIGDNVKHEILVSNKMTLSVFTKLRCKIIFPCLCILAHNATLNIKSYVRQISIFRVRVDSISSKGHWHPRAVLLCFY